MPRGPKPQPTKLKILRGNPGKRQLPTHEPQPTARIPDPPGVLGPLALAEWHRLAPELHRIGVLTMADRAVLASYCRLHERWLWAEARLRTAEEMVIVTSTGTLIQSPYVSMANRCLELMLKAAVELGLTPSSRVRLAVAGGTTDPLDDFLTRR